MFRKFARQFAPAIALSAAAFVSACSVDMGMGDFDGVPLAELDLTAANPDTIKLAGPDNVVISEGEQFSVDVTGDQEAVDALRFALDGDSLGIGRRSGGNVDGRARIAIVVTSLRTISLAGSGDIEAERLDGDGDINIAGSGTTRIGRIETDALDISIAGSGDVEGSGTSRSLDVSIAGSGSAKLRGLQVDNADISIAGSGDLEFSSDGTVDASIIGSGDVTVRGSAECSVSAVGSGKLRCGPAS